MSIELDRMGIHPNPAKESTAAMIVDRLKRRRV
jgi:hypothetical protein